MASVNPYLIPGTGRGEALAQGCASVHTIAPSALWVLIMASIVKNGSNVTCSATVSGGLPQGLAHVKSIMDSQHASHAFLGVVDPENISFSIGSVKLSAEEIKLMDADFRKLAGDYFPSVALLFTTLVLQVQPIGTTKESVFGITLDDVYENQLPMFLYIFAFVDAGFSLMSFSEPLSSDLQRAALGYL